MNQDLLRADSLDQLFDSDDRAGREKAVQRVLRNALVSWPKQKHNSLWVQDQLSVQHLDGLQLSNQRELVEGMHICKQTVQ
jgi:hypothetical protein